MKILIVDDHAACLTSLQMLLELESHEVTTAPDATVALEQLSNGHPFDLVITDHRMPDISGDEFFRHARQRMGVMTPPFVLHSAHQDELTADAAGLPWHACIPKGNPEQLRRCVQSLC